MTLGGGSVEQMTLPRFLDCAYTLLFDEYQRLGHDLVTAVEKLSGWAAGKPAMKAQVREESLTAKNDQALTQLQTMMRGVKKQ